MADITTYHLYTLVRAIMMCHIITCPNCSYMILYPLVTKNNSSLVKDENMIDSKMFDRLQSFEFLFLNKLKKSFKKNFD